MPFIFGERCPGWDDERLGGFHDIRPYHTKGDLYLAVQEGVLFNLYHCYRMLVAENGEPEKIRFSGGILHSPFWAQMCADIFQAELEIDKTEHASMLGAAVIGMDIAGIRSIGDYHPPAAGVIRPDPSQKEFYQEKFEKYLKCYESGC